MNKRQKSQAFTEEQTEKMEIVEKQAIKIAEIGSQLRQRRLDLSISLDEIAVQTMIRKSTIHAIEEGKLHQLPEPVYIQGLLLRYGNAVGFDGVAISQEFPLGDKRFGLKKFWFNLPGYFPRIKLHPLQLYCIYLVAIAIATQALSRHLNPIASQTENPAPEQTAAVLAAHHQASTKHLKNSVTAAEAVDRQRVRVGLTLKDSSWVVIEADGKTEFEGTLPSGTERSWEANEKLVVLAGNAGGVLLAVNNGQAEQMGAPGEVIEREVVRNQP